MTYASDLELDRDEGGYSFPGPFVGAVLIELSRWLNDTIYDLRRGTETRPGTNLNALAAWPGQAAVP